MSDDLSLQDLFDRDSIREYNKLQYEIDTLDDLLKNKYRVILGRCPFEIGDIVKINRGRMVITTILGWEENPETGLQQYRVNLAPIKRDGTLGIYKQTRQTLSRKTECVGKYEGEIA